MNDKRPPVVCRHCGATPDKCECQLLICHSCEARYKGKYRVVERAGVPAIMFRDQHYKCAREGWGSNINSTQNNPSSYETKES